MKAFGAPKSSYDIRISSRQLVDFFFKQVLRLDYQQYHDATKLIDRWHKTERDDFETQLNEIFAGDDRKQLLDLLKIQNLDELHEELEDHSSVAELKKLMSMLKASGVDNAAFDFSVIRGMDYYDDIIFEVFDTSPENNRSMFGGGRYNDLVSLFGVEPVPTVGFGMGDVTLQNFLELHKLQPQLESEINAAVILIGGIYEDAQKTLGELRSKGLNISVDSTDRKLDAKIKNAAKSGVKYAVFIGEQELESGKFRVKNLDSGDEKELGLDELVTEIS